MPYLGLLFNAFVWGLSWWPLRRLQDMGLHPLWATLLFFALGVLTIGVTHRDAWRLVLRTPGLWMLALATGVTNAAFNWGVATGEVVRVGDDGKPTALAHLREGSCFGERALLRDDVRFAGVVATAEVGMQTMRISRSDFEALLGPLGERMTDAYD